MTKQWTLKQTCARLAVLLFCCAALCVPLYAQNNKGTITGAVKDPNGAFVTGAKVTASNLATNEAGEATTGDDGIYTIPNLAPGEYKVTVEATGFKTQVRDKITVETNSRVPIDAQLEIGGVGGDVVTITGDAPIVESETSVRGDIITGRQVTDLPIPQRNFTLLAALSPGVTRPVSSTIGGGGGFSNGSGPVGSSTESTRFRESGGSVISANGARVTNNNFTLDGVDNNESQFGQIGIYPNPDAIQEFKVETSVPSAESGRAGGAIVSTTFKSGTNKVHGTVYEFYQGRAASAKPTNNRQPPNFVTHNFGGTVGGPIYLPRFGEGGPLFYNGENKSFFFVSYNGQRNGTPAFGGEFGFVTVPTARQRAGDFSEFLRPGETTTYQGRTFTRGTIFDRNGNPFPGNVIPSNQFDQVAFNYLNAFPLPTQGGLTNNFNRNRSERANTDGYDVKLDHNVTATNTVFGRYSKSTNARNRDNNFPLGSSPNGKDLASGFGAGNEFGNSRQVALGDTHTFSPNVVNDARAGYTRVNIGIFNPGVGGALGFSPTNAQDLGIPRTNICGVGCSGTILLGIVGNTAQPSDVEFTGDGGPFYFTSNNFFFGNTLTVIHGNQTFKFGGDIRLRQNANLDSGRAGNAKSNTVYTSAIQNNNGFFGQRNDVPIGPQESGSAITNLLLGYKPSSLSRGIPTGIPYLSNKEVDFFVQDDWKARSDLTLNLGLRYDVFTPQTERYDRQSNFDPATGNLIRTTSNSPHGRGGVETDRNNFGPRIGFAWSGLREDKKFVLRGGYGLLYATDVAGSGVTLSNNFLGGGGYNLNFADIAGNLPLSAGPPVPSLTLPPDTFRPNAGSQIFYNNPDRKEEIYHQYNLTAQYEFWPNWLAEAGYVASRGRNLLVIQNIGTNDNGARLVPFNNVVTENYNGKSWYDSLQTKLEKRFSRGLSILSTYTWAHALDNTPGGFCIQGPGASGCGPSNPVIGLSLDKANSDLDVRHRFTFSNVYDIPFGRGRQFGSDLPKALDYIIGGFQLNNVIQIQSGPVFSVTGSSGRADIIGDPFAIPSGSTRQLNRAAFRNAVTPIFASLPGGSKFGTSGRNIFRGPRQEFWDASLFKNIPVPAISEAFNVQLRIQAYNVLNHINHYRPNADINNGDFGLDRANSNQRQLEFSIKLLF